MAAQLPSYRYIASPFGGGLIERSPDGAFIPCNLENMDYQGFLAWMAEGNPAPEGWTGPTNAS